MFRNYLKSALRNLLRNRTSTVINILGLALGLAAFICIGAYVRYQRSYDRMLQPAGTTVYRVESSFYRGGQMTDDWPTSTNGYALALKDHFPEIADYTRINWNNSERVVRNGDIRFREAHVCFADSNFFSFFPYEWLKGNKGTALRDVNSVVISASAAHKYFGNEDPLGRLLEISTISTVLNCRVTGVFQDPPLNSTMQFSMLLSWASSPEWQKKTWYLHESYTFLKLVPGAHPSPIEAGFPAMAEGYKDGESLKDLRWVIHLVPLKDIHLNAAKQYEVEAKGNRRAVQFLNILSLAILLMACINYINLSTARALERAKEVGIRKVSGALPRQLMIQFFSESFLLGSLSLVLGIALSILAGVLLPSWLGIDHAYATVIDGSFCLMVGGVFLAAIALAGIYPSLVLTKFEPITVLKGRYSFSRGGALTRKGLVTFQFVIALALIAGTLAIYRQISYMSNQYPGIEIQQTLVLKAPVSTTGYDAKAAALRQELKTMPGITGVTGSGAVPGREVGMFLANRRFGADKKDERTYEMLKVDHDFIPLYHLDIIAGRSFDRSRPADSLGLVLNESSVRQFGFASPEDAIGKQVWLEVNPGRTNKVIGVVRDYHQRSLQMAYTPLILFMDPAYGWIPTQYFSIKVSTKDMAATLEKVRHSWERFFPGSSFDHFFLDEFYDRAYQDDRNFAKVAGLFCGLSIFIGIIGLLGLTAFSAARRTREMGVRKVLGASVGQIMSLLTWDLIYLILPAALIALPLSMMVIRQWMQGFAFRAPFSWSLLLAPVPVLILIILASTGWLTLRAARVNPVNSLKEE
jgi:putative ABC transport system permease protein